MKHFYHEEGLRLIHFNFREFDWKTELKQDVLMVVGLLLMMLSYNFFFVPNQLAPGGVTGLATIIYYLWGVPVGLMSAVINIPLFLISYKRMGRAFAARSLAAMLLLSLFLDTFPSFAMTEDLLLATIVGGALLGAGLALVLMGNASTGGTDLASAVINRLFPHLSFGTILLVIELCIVTFSGFVFGAQNALYAGVSLFLTSYIVDMLQEGVATSRLFFIISPQSGRIAQRIMTELERGVTALSGKGLYSGSDTSVIFSVVSKKEVHAVKKIVHEEDPHAFVVLTVANETMGEGFSRLMPK